MFTGLVRTLGVIRHREERGDLVLEIFPEERGFPLSIGASISCSGICLTVVTMTEDGAFTASLSAETLNVTTARDWQTGMYLNLEPSLKLGDELGGHFVSGHVDGVGELVGREDSGDSVVLAFKAPNELLQYIARKGSITVDGVSLTVNKADNVGFSVNIIPHTAAVTTLGTLRIGNAVNLEVDLLARYVARMLEFRA